MKKQTYHQVKVNNKQLVLDLILQNPKISRVDLAKLSGLSGGTITALTNELILENKIRESSKVSSNGGRPKISLEVVHQPDEILIFEIKQRSIFLKKFDYNNHLVYEKQIQTNYINGNYVVDTIITEVNLQPIKPIKVGVLIEENIAPNDITYLLSTGISQDNISLNDALKMFLDIGVTVDYTLKYFLNEEVFNVQLEKVKLYAYINIDHNLQTTIMYKGKELPYFDKQKKIALVDVLISKNLLSKWEAIVPDFPSTSNLTNDLIVRNNLMNKKLYQQFLELLSEALKTMLLFYPLDAIFLVGKNYLTPGLDQDLCELIKDYKVNPYMICKMIQVSELEPAKNLNKILVSKKLLGGI